MSEFKLPVLGFPSSTVQSSVTVRSTEAIGGGLLSALYSPPEPRTDYYRADIRTESGLREYLNQRRVHLLDPYEHLYWDTIH